MKITHNILLVIALILTGCNGTSSLDPEVARSENQPIRFAVSGDLSVKSKAVIDESNYTEFGFKALGALTVDTGNNYEIFGTNGVEVTYTTSGWGYSPVRYWQPGSYVFAGVMPSALSCTPSLSQTNHKQLTLDFADGFNLAQSQVDLLVAFDDVDVESVAGMTSTAVDFDFEHQLALVVIQGTSVDPDTKGIEIKEIKVYGNSPATVGDMVFTYAEATATTPSTISYDYELVSNTTKNNVYKTFSRPAEQTGVSADKDWNLVAAGESLVYDVLVPELLVFPQQCTFTIAITYKEDNIEKTRVGSLSADWEAGKKYTYTFKLATDITFSVAVSEWITANVNDTPIDII